MSQLARILRRSKHSAPGCSPHALAGSQHALGRSPDAPARSPHAPAPSLHGPCGAPAAPSVDPQHPDPIAAYVSELEASLRPRRMLGRRIVRKRVLTEVSSHLRESAEEIASHRPTTRATAEREAVARFGGAHELAAGIAAARRARPLAAQRLVALSAAWAAAMALGSATVWAAVQVQSTAHAATPARTAPGPAGLSPRRAAPLIPLSPAPGRARARQRCDHQRTGVELPSCGGVRSTRAKR